MRVLLRIGAITAAAFLGACTEGIVATPSSPEVGTASGASVVAGLQGTSWTLQAMTGAEAPVATVTLAFGAAPDAAGRLSVSGSAGCNDYVGTVEIAGARMTFSPLASTRKYCAAAGVMTLEDGYLAALGKVDRFSLAPPSLGLATGDGRTLSFRQR
jgi:heat shock protein HslJ